MAKNYYEITYLVVTDNDGLVSHTIKRIRELVSLPDEEEQDNENSNIGTGG